VHWMSPTLRVRVLMGMCVSGFLEYVSVVM
jgi:hypothetical protein